MAESSTSVDKTQLTTVISELRRLLDGEVSMLLDKIFELGASSDAVKELRFLLGEDTKQVLDEIEEIGGQTYKRWVMFDIDELGATCKKWATFNVEELQMAVKNVNKPK